MEVFVMEVGKVLAGLLNEDLVYIVIGALVAVQGVKWIISYLWRVPPTALIWFVVSPLATSPIAFFTWSFDARVPWFVVALVASVLANILFAVGLKQVLGRWAPDVYEQLNMPVNRRKVEAGPPPNTPDRRRPDEPTGGPKS